MNRVKIVLSIVVLSLFFMIVVKYPNTITLELGVFSGSNWGVPSGESYKIIDGAISDKKYTILIKLINTKTKEFTANRNTNALLSCPSNIFRVLFCVSGDILIERFFAGFVPSNNN